jgi:hypothetical protein
MTEIDENEITSAVQDGTVVDLNRSAFLRSGY